jgi:hypothetical protein
VAEKTAPSFFQVLLLPGWAGDQQSGNVFGTSLSVF